MFSFVELNILAVLLVGKERVLPPSDHFMPMFGRHRMYLRFTRRGTCGVPIGLQTSDAGFSPASVSVLRVDVLLCGCFAAPYAFGGRVVGKSSRS